MDGYYGTNRYSYREISKTFNELEPKIVELNFEITFGVFQGLENFKLVTIS